MFRIIRVDSQRAELLEPLGTKRKFWFRDKPDGPKKLFKAEERGTGDDWAEKLAAEFAGLLGLPHVHNELAMDEVGDVPGVFCGHRAKEGDDHDRGLAGLCAIDPRCGYTVD